MHILRVREPKSLSTVVNLLFSTPPILSGVRRTHEFVHIFPSRPTRTSLAHIDSHSIAARPLPSRPTCELIAVAAEEPKALSSSPL